MRRLMIGALLLTLLLACTGCSETMRTTQDLVDKAREEIPIADAQTTDLAYGGVQTMGERSLHWFISGKAYQAHYYLPMECESPQEGTYRFVRTYKPVTCAKDIALARWNEGYSFLVNNPDCAALRLTGQDGEMTEISLQGQELPFLYFYEGTPAQYLFLDGQGQELP